MFIINIFLLTDNAVSLFNFISKLGVQLHFYSKHFFLPLKEFEYNRFISVFRVSPLSFSFGFLFSFSGFAFARILLAFAFPHSHPTPPSPKAATTTTAAAVVAAK